MQVGLLESVQTNSGSMPEDMAVTMGGDLVYTDSNDQSINILKGAEIQPLVMIQELIGLVNWYKVITSVYIFEDINCR